jgi:hypothetical protein
MEEHLPLLKPGYFIERPCCDAQVSGFRCDAWQQAPSSSNSYAMATPLGG